MQENEPCGLTYPPNWNRKHVLDGVLMSMCAIDENSHHLLSFNTLLELYIPQIVDQYGKLTTLLSNRKYSIKISGAVAKPDQTTPSDCYLFGLNLSCAITANIELSTDDPLIPAISQRCVIARLPLMTGKTVLSSPLDYLQDTSDEVVGGFLVRGKLRTIPVTKTPLVNFPIITVKKNLYVLQVRSVHADKIFRSTSTIEMIIEKNPKKAFNAGVITVRLPFQSTTVHVSVLAQAFGANPERFIGLVRAMAGSRYDDRNFRSYEISMKYHKQAHIVQDVLSAQVLIAKLFGKGVLSTGKGILRNETFPHLRDEVHETSYNNKLIFLAYCVSLLILTRHEILPVTPRDDYSYSKCVTSANHLGSLFRLLFIQHVRTSGKLLRRALMKAGASNDSIDNPTLALDLGKIYGEQRLSARIMSALASGIWSVLRKGVSISLNSNNKDAILMQLRRISSNLSTTDGSHTTPRSVRHDQYGFICAAYSPDGDSTGLVYEMASTAIISPAVHDNGECLRALIIDLFSEILMPVVKWLQKPFSLKENEAFYFDPKGILSHICLDVSGFVYRFRSLRRNLDISPFAFVGFFLQRHELRVQCEEGILARPVIVASRYEDIKREDSFQSLLARGIIEYISPQEATTLCSFAVCLEERIETTTHIEITEASFLGLNASSVPNATSEQGPRLSYFTSQLKQVIVAKANIRRGSVAMNTLWYAFRSLVRTKMDIMRNSNDTECRGTPCVLAFITLQDCQEDALIIKRSFLERGGMMATTSRVYVSEAAAPNSLLSETFERPDEVLSKKTANYDVLEPNGLPRLGAMTKGGDVIVGKTRSVRKIISGAASTYDSSVKKNINNSKTGLRTQRHILTRRDISTCSRKDESGTITAVSTATLPNGKRVSVDISTARHIVVGDKFTSSAAQKGVVASIYNDEDMPFSMVSGMTPDIIASPLSLTSRMTMSSLLEQITGKAVAISGDLELGIDHQDYHNSNKLHIKRVEEVLSNHGFCSDGTEIMMDGKTGRELHGRVTTGVINYNRLLHLAKKKIHARATVICRVFELFCFICNDCRAREIL
jgi:DNA-directed RNA polymerase beta subunit